MKKGKTKQPKGVSKKDSQQLYEDPKQPIKQQPAPGRKTTKADQQESSQAQRHLQQEYGPQKKAQGVKDLTKQL